MTLPHIDGLLLDMDGVLGVSWTPLPGAAEAVTRLHAAGVPMRVVTNTTALPQTRFGAVLREAGFPFADEDILTASVLAGAWLRAERPRARVFLIGDAQPEDLDGIELVGADEAPDVVLVSGADDSFCFATFNRVLALLRDGAELVAMHRNLFWMTRRGEKLDAGAYLLGLEAATGLEAVVLGKPAPTVLPRRPRRARPAGRARGHGRRRRGERRPRRPGGSASPACSCARASSARTSSPVPPARPTTSSTRSSTSAGCSASDGGPPQPLRGLFRAGGCGFAIPGEQP